VDDWAKLRIETTLDAEGSAWHAQPDERHPALIQPDAI
jgi:8-oxo-dGTP diphosphatase